MKEYKSSKIEPDLRCPDIQENDRATFFLTTGRRSVGLMVPVDAMYRSR